MTTPMLAPVRKPPHDPLSLLLDGLAGWSVAQASDVMLASGMLRLARNPAALRRLTQDGGSFGGLRLPANMARSPDGTVWLLDAGTGRLLRFDPCRCAFVPVRLLGHGGAIAVGGSRLFASDAGRGWLDVLTLPTTARSDRWRPPEPWQPAGVLVDRHRQVRVADPSSGRLHTFSWTGRYLGYLEGIGASCYLAEDLDGIVYAAGPTTVYRIDADVVTEIADTADELPGRWAPVPPVGRDGAVLLGGLCVPPVPVRFDSSGTRVAAAEAVPAAPYLTSGSVILGPLDSGIDTCVWHRVVLHGDVPAGCSVGVSAFTANAELPGSQIDHLPDAWAARAPAGSADRWDCLIAGDPGRYLWLRLQLAGTGALTPRLAAVEVEFPRISLRRYLPAVYGAEPDSAAFTDRFLSLFDRGLRDVESRIDELPASLDPSATPFLDWLSGWVGLAVDSRLPEPTRRRLLARSARLYDLRGTREGLRELLLIVLGLDQRAPCPQRAREPGRCRCARPGCPPPRPARATAASWMPPPLVLEHFRLRRWLRLGEGRIGSEAQLWGRNIVNRSQLGHGAQVGGTQLKASQDPLRDPFHVYAHRYTVFVPASAGRTPVQRRIMQRLLDFGTPAHTAGTIEYVEPRMRLGVQSCLGLDSVIARVPTGLVLGGTLGATVLTGEAGAAPTPPQLGTTTVLR